MKKLRYSIRPFVLVGLYMIFGRFFIDAAQRNRTWYGITNRRLIIAKSLFNRSISRATLSADRK